MKAVEAYDYNVVYDTVTEPEFVEIYRGDEVVEVLSPEESEKFLDEVYRTADPFLGRRVEDSPKITDIPEVQDVIEKWFVRYNTNNTKGYK